MANIYASTGLARSDRLRSVNSRIENSSKADAKSFSDAMNKAKLASVRAETSSAPSQSDSQECRSYTNFEERLRGGLLSQGNLVDISANFLSTANVMVRNEERVLQVMANTFIDENSDSSQVRLLSDTDQLIQQLDSKESLDSQDDWQFEIITSDQEPISLELSRTSSGTWTAEIASQVSTDLKRELSQILSQRGISVSWRDQ